MGSQTCQTFLAAVLLSLVACSSPLEKAITGKNSNQENLNQEGGASAEGANDGTNSVGTSGDGTPGPDFDADASDLAGNATAPTPVGGSPFLEAYFLKCVADANIPPRTGMTSFGCGLQYFNTTDFMPMSFFLPFIARDLAVAEANVQSPVGAEVYDILLRRTANTQTEVVSSATGPYHWHVWVPDGAAAKTTISVTFGGGGKLLSRTAVAEGVTPKLSFGAMGDYHFGSQQPEAVTKETLGVPADWKVELQPFIEKRLTKIEIPITVPGGNISVGVRLDSLLGVNTYTKTYDLGCYDNEGNLYLPINQGTLHVQSAQMVLTTSCQNSGNTEVNARLIIQWFQPSNYQNEVDPTDDFVIGQINFFSEQNIVVPPEANWTKIYAP